MTMTHAETIEPLTDTAPALVGSFVLTPAIFASKESVDDVLEQIRDEAERFKATRDISTPAGRAAIASFAYKIARSKTALDELGKTTVAEWKTKANAVDEERRRIRCDLDALKDDVRAPLDVYEENERVRCAEHEERLRDIDRLAIFAGQFVNSAIVRDRLVELAKIGGENFEEFAERATRSIAAADRILRARLELEEREEADELARQREEAEHLQREQRAREDWIAREAREQAEQRAAAAERAQRELAERIERDRVAAHTMALARVRSFETVDAARSSAELKIALENLEALYRGRDWQEFADEASQACDVSQQSLEHKIATAREREDIDRRDRDAAIAREAAAAEQQRQADAAAAAAAEQERRENNRRIRTRVRRQIAEAIDKKIRSMVNEDLSGDVIGSVPALADFIAGLLVDGEVPNVTVTF